MNTVLTCLLLVLGIAFTAGARAGEENLDIDTKFRAKLAKEKIKQAANERENDRREKNLQGGGSDCGSQNIGNVDTNGRPGTAPREVFVFAPNAINFVGAGGCR
jgi:hypothetical protein